MIYYQKAIINITFDKNPYLFFIISKSLKSRGIKKYQEY